MRIFDLFSLIIDNLGRRKGRVVLTAIGVVIGTAAIVLLVSLAIGLQRNATSQLWGIGDLKRIDVNPNYEMMDSGPMGGGGGGGTGQSGQPLLITPKTIEDIQAIPGVETVIARDYLMGGGQMRFGRLETWANIMGIGTKDLTPFDYKLAAGSLQLERGTAIIGGWMMKNWYDPKWRPGLPEVVQPTPEDMVNKQVTLELIKWSEDGTEIRKKVQVRIVGILEENRSDADSMMFMSLEDVTAYNEWFMGKRINRNRDGFPMLVARVVDPKQVVDIAEQINALGYMATTPQTYVEGLNSFFVVLQVIFGGVGAIALLVAAIGIANTMTMAILERTREIGLMKAIGATNRDVLTIFLGESAGIGLVGGIGGVIFGWGGSEVLNVVATTYFAQQSAQTGNLPMGLAAYTPPWLPIFAVIFATLVGLLSGLYPSLRAATLVPVTALKYE
jgi:putative ABC transport system permease protein